jgi:hypothetical protein
MPTETIASDPVPLCARPCKFAECKAVFYVCQRCDRRRCYCSKKCRLAARRLGHRVANSKYQRTDRGRRSHAHRQRTYRKLRRSRTQNKVTDPSFPTAETASSFACDDAPPAPHPPIQLPPSVHTSPPPIPEGGLRCHFCGCRGYLRKRDPDEPDSPRGYP